jgi:hypothetical protein
MIRVAFWVLVAPVLFLLGSDTAQAGVLLHRSGGCHARSAVASPSACTPARVAVPVCAAPVCGTVPTIPPTPTETAAKPGVVRAVCGAVEQGLRRLASAIHNRRVAPVKHLIQRIRHRRCG